MKLRSLMILVALVAMTAGGKVAYDRYRGADSQLSLETPPQADGCSLCAAHKADLELMREENQKRALGACPSNGYELHRSGQREC